MAIDSANPFVQEFYGHTTIHPLGLCAALMMGLLVLTVPRRYAIWPIIFIVCFIASAQRLVIAGADFTLLRLMVLFGTARVFASGEWRPLRWNALDTTVLLWAMASAVIPILRMGRSVAMNRAGLLYDAIGLYFLFRVLIKDWDDARMAIWGLTWASLPVASLILLEWQTGHNLFAIFGGVPEITSIREGRMRCQGAFEHPILIGTFFAAVLPLAAALWWQDRRRRFLVVASCVACFVIIIASASATPLTGVVAAAIGAAWFPLRYRMRWLRWGIALTVVTLHMVMLQPVWHLVARVSVVGGNSAWHRFLLIDGAIQHFDEWWLMGSDLGTGHWGYFTFDATNFYVVLGQHGGVVLLLLFVAVLVTAFRQIGRTWRGVAEDWRTMILAWAMGVAVWVHMVNFVGIAYFGQSWMGWYLLLALIGSTAAPSPVKTRRTVTQPSRRPASRYRSRHAQSSVRPRPSAI